MKDPCPSVLSVVKSIPDLPAGQSLHLVPVVIRMKTVPRMARSGRLSPPRDCHRSFSERFPYAIYYLIDGDSVATGFADA